MNPNKTNEYKSGLVSVIIPTYKRADMIGRAIESVLNQSYGLLECIVVNDNEIGDSDSIALYASIERFKSDHRFIFIEQEKHINGAVARNVGIKSAKGEYIAFLDDDDYWEKDKLFYQVEFLKNNDSSWGAVTCLSTLMSNGHLLRASMPFNGGDMLMAVLYRRIGLGTGPTLVRHEAIDNFGMFDESLKRHQDLQFFSQLTAKYKVGVVKKHLCNIDCSNTINKPNVDSIISIKKAYYESIRNVLETLSKRQLKRFYIMHNFELAYAYFSNGKKKEAFKKALGVLKSPVTFYLALERIFRRKIGQIFKNHLVKKY